MPVGGAEDFAVAVSRYLPEPFHPVFVCLRELGARGEELRKAGREIHLVRIAPGKRWNIAGILRLARWFRKEKIALVHSQTYNSHTYAIPAARLAGVGCVLHHQKTFEPLRPHRMLMMRFLARSSHRVVALSERTRRDLIRAFRLSESRTIVIPNVVDPAEFFPVKDRADLRRKLGLDADAFLIGSVASLNAVKNHPATLRVLGRLNEENVPFGALLLGEGKDRAFLESLRNDLKLERRVSLPGNKSPLAPWLQALDLVVHASRSEGQPLALLQAIACRIPVLASRIEGNIAVLGERHPGLFELDSLEEYHRLLLRCIREDAFRKELLASQDRLLDELPRAPRVAKELAMVYGEIAS
jgi:glycosyltransferase involved in cell wall biosynthesis